MLLLSIFQGGLGGASEISRAKELSDSHYFVSFLGDVETTVRLDPLLFDFHLAARSMLYNKSLYWQFA